MSSKKAIKFLGFFIILFVFSSSADQLGEPLEYFELEDLVLICIISDVVGTKVAIIEDPTGEIRKVVIGNYIGKNHGRITSISDRQIFIEEIIKKSDGWEKRETSKTINESLGAYIRP